MLSKGALSFCFISLLHIADQATRRFCKNCSDAELYPRAARIGKSIEGFIPITSSDTLTLVLDALSSLLVVQHGTWVTVELAQTLVPAVLSVYAKGAQGTRPP